MAIFSVNLVLFLQEVQLKMWIRIKIILDSQQCIKGNLPVTDVFNVLWDGGIGPNTVAIHQRNQFAFLEKKEQSCTKHIQCC